uniref:Uncharacterized protein n=1 Tax=Oryza punctata TaxID=4537 RepID=A0A0E0KN37_ORYPU
MRTPGWHCFVFQKSKRATLSPAILVCPCPTPPTVSPRALDACGLSLPCQCRPPVSLSPAPAVHNVGRLFTVPHPFRRPQPPNPIDKKVPMANLNTYHLATWAVSAKTRNPAMPGFSHENMWLHVRL